MQVIRSLREMQRLALRWRRAGVRVAFVPTMGYLHGGHVSLVERARKAAGRQGKIVVSIYVNPTQFAPSEDLGRYPRDLARDRQLCRAAGTDVLFVPTDEQMYPAGYSTYVTEEKLSKLMEGASRPTHFRGVTTVVAKLFNIILPDIAVFGAKDFQQAGVIRKMVSDLNLPVKVLVARTVREADGLAMSSRNKYLQGSLRRQAAALFDAIQCARRTVRVKKAVAGAALRKELKGLIETRPAARVDYIEFFDPATLAPVDVVNRRTRMVLAVFVGSTRLIDNGSLGGEDS